MSATPTKSDVYLSPRLAGTLMTPEEFDAVRHSREGYLYELINGVLVVHPIPYAAERKPNHLLGYYLTHYQLRHPQGSCLDDTLEQQYVRTRTNRRIADRLIWTGLGRAPDPDRDLPSVAVEFVSRRRRDRVRDYVEKRKEYLDLGMKEYWIFDRFRRTLTVYSKKGRKPMEQVVREHETYKPPLLPGFELPVAQILEAADRYSGRRNR
jgi:Uma2 family endonuclease